MTLHLGITQALLGEDAVFGRRFDELEVHDDAAEGRWPVEGVAVALARHTWVEEELLFPRLASRVGSGGALQAMHVEQDVIDRALARLPDAKDSGQAWQLIRDVIAVARVDLARE